MKDAAADATTTVTGAAAVTTTRTSEFALRKAARERRFFYAEEGKAGGGPKRHDYAAQPDEGVEGVHYCLEAEETYGVEQAQQPERHRRSPVALRGERRGAHSERGDAPTLCGTRFRVRSRRRRARPLGQEIEG